jgi:hypothetical protein
MPNIEISSTTTTVLGFHDAGWADFCRYLLEHGFKINTTTQPVFESEASIYGRHHGMSVIYQKSGGKSKEPASVASALKQVKSMLISLQEPESRDRIATYIICEILMEYDLNDDDDLKKFQDKMQLIEDSEQPSHALLDELIKYCKEFDTKSGDLDLVGYGLCNILRRSNKISDLLCGEDCKIIDKLSEWIGYVNLETKGYETQYPITASKRLIVDTLQINLQNLQEGKPLIPLKMVISARLQEGEPLFLPDWRRATRKMGFVFTNAEARMIYKLTKELDDPLINYLMHETVQFYEMHGLTFVEKLPPWAEPGEEEIWQDRIRSRDKLSYRERPQEQTQEWVRELCQLSNSTAESIGIENTEEQIQEFFTSRPDLGHNM